MQRSSLSISLIAFFGAVAGQPATAQFLLLRPEYTEGSIASTASTRAGRLAPNTAFTIYGKDLSFITWAVSPQEIVNQQLPTSTPRGEVYVQLQGRRIPLFYVSPRQINGLIPADVLPGERTIRVFRDLVSGPTVTVRIDAEAPEFFRLPTGFAAATHADGRVISAESPAEEDEVVVVYGTGFGAVGAIENGVLAPSRPAQVLRAREYRIRVEGEELPAEALFYVGATPLYAGLFQANLRLPKPLGENVRIEIGVGGNWSGGDLRLNTKKSATQ